ncbi:Uncharacterised protein [Vibrio cholerae]|nr:Uncharacterised protein [Vibrio cholerae]
MVHLVKQLKTVGQLSRHSHSRLFISLILT